MLLNKLQNYILRNYMALCLSRFARGRADDIITVYREMTPLAVTLMVQLSVQR